ncbi:MAG: lactate racemase domain-containing protein [Candidatus Jordarchaeaceae archaeon]
MEKEAKVALDKVVIVSVMLFSELMSAIEMVDTSNASSRFKSCVEKVVEKHPEVLRGFNVKWLGLNAFVILDNLSKIDGEEERREKYKEALFDLLQNSILCGEELGMGFDDLDKPAFIYNVNHPLLEQYDLAKGIVHDKLVWFKKEKIRREENKNKIIVSLRCRDRSESAKIPKQILSGVIEPPKITHKKFPINSIDNILNEPLGTDSLVREVSGAQNVAIIIDYDSLPTTSGILKLVLNDLKKAQIPQINIVVACGLNKPNSNKSISRILGSNILKNYNVTFHDSLDEDNLTEVGRTLSGARLKINTKVMDADYRIAIGSIHPHPYSGFTGGYQTILPGVAGAEAIVCNQVRGMLLNSRIGFTEKNPVYRDSQSVAPLCSIDFIINTIVDCEGNIVDLVAGNPEDAYRKGVEISRRLFAAKVDGRVEMVILAPGKPYDQDFYSSLQSIGAIKNLLTPHGLTVLIADLNHKDSRKLGEAMALKHHEFLDMVYKDPKSLLIRNVLEFMGRNLILVSRKILKNIGRLPIINVNNLSEAIDQANRIIKPSSILVVHEAWNTIPEFKNGERPFSADF